MDHVICESKTYWYYSLSLDSCCRIPMDKERGIRIYKNKNFFSSSTATLVWSRIAVGKSLHTQRCRESEQSAEIDLKTPTGTHTAKLLHSCNACFRLVTAYIYGLLVPHWSQLTHTYFIHRVSRPHISFFPVVQLILSSSGCIWQLHPPGSLPVKAICCILF